MTQGEVTYEFSPVTATTTKVELPPAHQSEATRLQAGQDRLDAIRQLNEKRR